MGSFVPHRRGYNTLESTPLSDTIIHRVLRLAQVFHLVPTL